MLPLEICHTKLPGKAKVCAFNCLSEDTFITQKRKDKASMAPERSVMIEEGHKDYLDFSFPFCCHLM